MWLIENGYAVSRSLLAGLLPALFGFAVFHAGLAAAQDIRQIKLTEKHIAGYIAADDEMARLYGAGVDNTDPKVRAQAEAVAKKNGFSSLAEYDDVAVNIAILMSHIDANTRRFIEPAERIRQEIASLKADGSITEDAKQEALAELETALKGAKPIEYKENIALVTKHYDKLLPLMQVLGPAD